MSGGREEGKEGKEGKRGRGEEINMNTDKGITHHFTIKTKKSKPSKGGFYAYSVATCMHTYIFNL